MSPSCSSCRFWQNFDDGLGKCRRHAPIVSDGTIEAIRWPVSKSSDWCGEYEPQPTPEEVLRDCMLGGHA